MTPPEVRYLILCNEVRADEQNYLRLDVYGLLTHIRSKATPPFPFVRPELTVLVVLTDCHGAGEFSIRIVQTVTGRVIFRNPPRLMRFGGEESDAIGIAFRIKDCVFPAQGAYWVELLFSGAVIARQALTVRLRASL